MKTYSRWAPPALTRQLITAGVLSEDAQDNAMTHPAPRGLLISQIDGMLENSACDPDFGYGTGYCLSLHIAVELSTLKIWEWRLDLPWEDRQFQWVLEPLGSKFPNNIYRVPGCPWLEFPRDVVINHRHVLRPGRGLDGLLLGFGHESIPESYHHGAYIDASLVLIDQMGREIPTPVQFFANRMAKLDRKRAKKNPRRGLLENLDCAAEELALK